MTHIFKAGFVEVHSSFCDSFFFFFLIKIVTASLRQRDLLPLTLGMRAGGSFPFTFIFHQAPGAEL